MRRSSILFLVVAVQAAFFAAAMVHAGIASVRSGPELRETTALVERLQLTDLCLFTEARYTRHPTQADRHAAFQDHPLSLEHFPSGSLLGPPAGLRQP
jgi:hypothetical protein